MGGHNAGEIASQMIAGNLGEIQETPVLSAYVDAIEDSLISAHKELLSLGAEKEDIAGSTVVALLAGNRHGLVMWAGDSRLYLHRQGRLTQLTEDHSYVDDLVERGEISREEAETHPQANVITRAVGAGETLYLDMDVTEVQDGDVFLLCSDGLYREVSEEEICNILANESLFDIARELIDLTLSRGAKDNVTVVVVRALAIV